MRTLALILAFGTFWGPTLTAEESVHTEHIPFAPGGAIRIENSYGYLTVEGWDEPEVAITVTKSPNSDVVRVSTERHSENEVTVSTQPGRNKLLIFSWPLSGKRHVTAEYTIRVPRDSRVEIQHDYGYVWVSDVAGGMKVHSHTGDITVLLPDTTAYAIDARTAMGGIASDFAGRGHKKLLVGTRFNYGSPDAKSRVELRMGRGSIAILNGPPSGPLWKN